MTSRTVGHVVILHLPQVRQVFTGPFAVTKERGFCELAACLPGRYVRARERYLQYLYILRKENVCIAQVPTGLKMQPRLDQHSFTSQLD